MQHPRPRWADGLRVENCQGEEITIDCPVGCDVALPDIVTETTIDIIITLTTGEFVSVAAVGDPVGGGDVPDQRFGAPNAVDDAAEIELADAEAEAEAEAWKKNSAEAFRKR